MATCATKQVRFFQSLRNVEQTQSHYLMRLVRRNADTLFGRKHAFSRIHSVSDYLQAVPVADYNDFSHAIERISQGEANILTCDPVTLFHPTSGSRSATKLIPWTASLTSEFQRGIAPWLVTLYSRKPAIMKGTAYWSISPPGSVAQSHGSIRVGFDDDSDYLGVIGKKLFSQVNALPSQVKNWRDIQEFRLQTLVGLLGNETLSLISVWSPTFLTVLLEELIRDPESILKAMSNTASAERKQRTAYLYRLLDNRDESLFEKIWPNLQVISCWTHGASKLYSENLRTYFPNTEIQPKGLVATEALVSIPCHPEMDPVLAVNSHFYEFCDPTTGRICLAHELMEGGLYSVLVTTGGGLYRYKLGDLIRVTGFLHQAPCSQFVGREGVTSDLFGEKLQDSVVEELIRVSLAQLKITARFFLLAPTSDSLGQTAYTLFLDAEPYSSLITVTHRNNQG